MLSTAGKALSLLARGSGAVGVGRENRGRVGELTISWCRCFAVNLVIRDQLSFVVRQARARDWVNLLQRR